ncbi:MAG: hypothetical protein ACJA0V_000382 [Planctomycetota bacterium]|jgi:hypothetical protein
MIMALRSLTALIWGLQLSICGWCGSCAAQVVPQPRVHQQATGVYCADLLRCDVVEFEPQVEALRDGLARLGAVDFRDTAGRSAVVVFKRATFDSAEQYKIVISSKAMEVTAGLAYLTLAIMLNSTEIRASSRRLTVKSGPLPFPGSVDVHSEDIDQIWVEEKISQSRSSKGRTSTSVHFPVFMRMQDGTKKTLLRYGQDSDMSLFLEQQIEMHLGIEDRAVRGEF